MKIIVLQITLVILLLSGIGIKAQQSNLPEEFNKLQKPQQNYLLPEKFEELQPAPIDTKSIGIAGGFKILHDDAAELDNVFFAEPVDFNQQVEDSGYESVQLSLRYGLQHYLLAGIFVGIKLDYSYVNIDDISLEVLQNGNPAFLFDGSFLLIDTFAIVPHIEFSLFTIIEQVFFTDLPPSWDIYIYGGPRLNFNIYSEDDLDIEETETLVLGYEAGIGLEIFISPKWSMRLEYAYYTNSSEFEVEVNNIHVFDGELNLDASRFIFGFHRYF